MPLGNFNKNLKLQGKKNLSLGLARRELSPNEFNLNFITVSKRLPFSLYTKEASGATHLVFLIGLDWVKPPLIGQN